MGSTSNQKRLNTGHTVERLDEEANKRIQKNYTTYGPLVRLHPGGWFYEENALQVIEKCFTFKFKPTDVIAMTLPKSGTTWLQEILWTMLHSPNLDNPDATKLNLDLRSMNLEGDLLLKIKNAPKMSAESESMFKNFIRKEDPSRADDDLILYTYTDLCLKDPRVIKTHLNVSLLHADALKISKIVYVARDPRDVITSRFNFVQLFNIHGFKGTFDEFLELFVEDELFYTPFWLHIKEAWELRNHPNFLFLFYEDMVLDPITQYKKINDFLGTNLTDLQVKNIVEFTKFSNTKKRNEEGTSPQPFTDTKVMFNQEVKNKTGGFYRKGTIGNWKDNFTPEQAKMIENWVKKSTKNYPDDFPYLAK